MTETATHTAVAAEIKAELEQLRANNAFFYIEGRRNRLRVLRNDREVTLNEATARRLNSLFTDAYKLAVRRIDEAKATDAQQVTHLQAIMAGDDFILEANVLLTFHCGVSLTDDNGTKEAAEEIRIYGADVGDFALLGH